MKELVELSEKLDALQGKMKTLEEGYVPINNKKLQQVLEATLKDLFRDEEKIGLLRQIKLLGITFGVIIILLLCFVIFLAIFTVPVTQ